MDDLARAGVDAEHDERDAYETSGEERVLAGSTARATSGSATVASRKRVRA